MTLKKIVPIAIVVAVVLLAGGFFVYSRLTGSGGGSTTLNILKKDSAFSGTLKAALELGIPLKCSSKVEGEIGQGTAEGIVQGKQYAGKMMIKGVTQNVLMKDNCMWSWKEGTTQGIKTCFQSAEDNANTSAIPTGNPASDQMNTNVSCLPTTIGPGTFSVPGNIKFLDIDSLGSDMTEEQQKQLEEMSKEYGE